MFHLVQMCSVFTYAPFKLNSDFLEINSHTTVNLTESEFRLFKKSLKNLRFTVKIR
jgi:hypothetical protein